MNIPDQAVYAMAAAFVAPATIAIVWIGRRFVEQSVGPKGERGEPGQPGPSMSVRDYKAMAGYLTGELNGRYMMADESREKFGQLERKVDEHAAEVRRFIEHAEPILAILVEMMQRSKS